MLTRAYRVTVVVLSVVLILAGLTGCGKASNNRTEKQNSGQVGDINAPDKASIIAFTKEFSPLLADANQLHQETITCIKKYGYAEINPAQALKQIINIENKTNIIRKRLDEVPAKGSLEEIKGEFSTSLYLKQQNISKLRKIFQEPNPESSVLNKILQELKGSEGFLEKSKGDLVQLEQSVGMQE